VGVRGVARLGMARERMRGRIAKMLEAYIFRRWT
jgi:hypothetical protein